MPDSASLKKSPNLDKWISVASDGRVLIHTGKVDIGQRISTALALIAAEELDVDLSRIDIARTETGVDPDEGITSGSNSMEEAGNAVRAASAQRVGICCPSRRIRWVWMSRHSKFQMG